MKYSVDYTKRAEKELQKLDKPIRTRIYDWIDKNLVNCENPRQFGKALTGNHYGEWRYRVGDYRILAEIHDDRIIILVTSVGHRREVY